MSVYERKRWNELESHWQKKAERRKVLPPRAREAVSKATDVVKSSSSKAGTAISEAAPEKLKNAAGGAIDATLVPTVGAVVQVLELINDWIVELTDPEVVLRHHREAGREVGTLEDLHALDLEVLDQFTNRMSLRWRTFGAGQGAAFGALAMIPVPVLGSVAAITLDMVAMQALTTAIAARACYAYGFDAGAPEMKQMVERMVVRAYRNQAPKAGAISNAGAAFAATKNRVNWSQKLREDHRLMAAVEKLLKRVGEGGRVPVQNARMGMPVVSVFVGAGTNSLVLGDTAKQARQYAATVFLAEKYGLELPSTLGFDLAGSAVESVDDGSDL